MNSDENKTEEVNTEQGRSLTRTDLESRKALCVTISESVSLFCNLCVKTQQHWLNQPDYPTDCLDYLKIIWEILSENLRLRCTFHLTIGELVAKIFQKRLYGLSGKPTRRPDFQRSEMTFSCSLVWFYSEDFLRRRTAAFASACCSRVLRTDRVRLTGSKMQEDRKSHCLRTLVRSNWAPNWGRASGD